MTVILISLCIFFWWLVGFLSWVYVWTSDADVRMGDLPILALAGCTGPLSILPALATYFTNGQNKSVFKKRKG